MNDMLPHQERVVVELAELDDKMTKLLAFFSSEMFKTLCARDQDLLVEQYGYMTHYARVLKLRIAAFA